MTNTGSYGAEAISLTSSAPLRVEGFPFDCEIHRPPTFLAAYSIVLAAYTSPSVTSMTLRLLSCRHYPFGLKITATIKAKRMAAEIPADVSSKIPMPIPINPCICA